MIRALKNAGLLLLLPAMLMLIVEEALAGRWVVLSGHDETELIFHSKASLESFDGKTKEIDGWIEFETTELADSASWWVEVPLASLDTGIGLRNTHMRENHLHTDKYPTAVFHGGRLTAGSATSLTEGEPLYLTLLGEFRLHGVAREREIPVEIHLLSDGELLVSTEFPVSLADHGIPRPKFLMMKLADVQQVRLRFRARPETVGTP